MTPPVVQLRQLRLASGLVLFAYVAAHLVNHALGLVSVAFAERGLGVAIALWHSLPGTLVLYGAAGVHVSLALQSLYARRTLRMAPLDLWRIVLGLGIPTLLIGHAVSTRLAWELYQQPSQYSRVVWTLWTSDAQGRQLALLVPGWLHGCFGLHLAFSSRPLYRRLHAPLLAIAVLLPVLGGLGFLAMGKELAADPTTSAQLAARLDLPGHAKAVLVELRVVLLNVYVFACGCVFAARALRGWMEHRSGALVGIRFPQRTVRVPRGWSVLEASRSHHLVHVSQCGGRARCSTCRVQVLAGLDHCPVPGPAELATLERIGAGPSVRLACQLRPRGDIDVIPLLHGRDAASGHLPGAPAAEQDLVLLALDWRNANTLARQLLPQDAVYLSTRFAHMVRLCVGAQDGVACHAAAYEATTAFGMDANSGAACRHALLAACDAEILFSQLADQWRREFGVAPDFGVCVHLGVAAVAGMGDSVTNGAFVAGPAASALQDLRAAATLLGARAVVSMPVLHSVGVDPEGLAGAQAARGLTPDGVAFVALGSLQPLGAWLRR